MYIPRTATAALHEAARHFPVLTVTGPRQSGKTTLVRREFPGHAYVSLEGPDRLLEATEDPRLFLDRHPGGLIIDEVQRAPELMSFLQERVDEDRRPGRYVLTGSQQFGLHQRITQSLAGRSALIPLLPFSYTELSASGHAPSSLEDLLAGGLYPSVRAEGVPPALWYRNYVATYVERDVRQMINVRNLAGFRRFIQLVAGRTGQLVNYANLAADAGVSQPTVKTWLSVLEASYLIVLLQPHHANFSKRLIKSPKLYVLDPGLAAWLVGIRKPEDLLSHAMRGPLFETWVVAELLKARLHLGKDSNLGFWRDRSGLEVDVVFGRSDSLSSVEIKSGRTVGSDWFASLRRWKDLAGDAAGPGWLVYGGDESQVRRQARVVPWSGIADLVQAVQAD